MSQWKGPFEELYYKALKDGAHDIAQNTSAILRDAGLSEEQIVNVAKAFQEKAESVQQRHAYTRGTLSGLPSVPKDRKAEATYSSFVPG